MAAELWQRLIGTNELYAETIVAHPDGRPLRVSYAGHGTTIDGCWHALMVMLSVRVEPGGAELIKADKGAPADGRQRRSRPASVT